MNATHPLHPFARAKVEPPHSIPEVNSEFRYPLSFKWHGHVSRVLCTAQFGKQLKRPGRYVHRIDSMAGIWRGRTLHLAARWLCGSPGTRSAAIVLDPADEEICPYCEDQRLGPAVYRCFDEGACLLYVGATSQLTRRLDDHRRSKAWWPQVAEARSHRFSSIEAARAAEATAIRLERPLRNTHRNASPHPSRVTTEGGAS